MSGSLESIGMFLVLNGKNGIEGDFSLMCQLVKVNASIKDSSFQCLEMAKNFVLAVPEMGTKSNLNLNCIELC